MRIKAFQIGTIIAINIFSPNICGAQETAALPETFAIQSPSTSERLTALFSDLRGRVFGTSDQQDAATSVDSAEATAAVTIDKDYTIQTGSISSLSTGTGFGSGTPGAEPGSKIPLCGSIPAPPATLKTKSKYKADRQFKILCR